MPDHIHFLCEGLFGSSDLITFLNAFKQRTAYEFRKKHGSRLWQMRYDDHILRPKEVIEDAAATSGGIQCGKASAATPIFILCPVHKPSTG